MAGDSSPGASAEPHRRQSVVAHPPDRLVEAAAHPVMSGGVCRVRVAVGDAVNHVLQRRRNDRLPPA